MVNVFVYDRTFEGLLTVVFDAYSKKIFPNIIVSKGDSLPLFYEHLIHCRTDRERPERVWKALEKKLSHGALSQLVMCWISEERGVDMLLFRYICKVFDTCQPIETNFADEDVLGVFRLSKKISQERGHILQFLRFQRTKDDVYFAAIEPLYNVLPFTVDFLKDRFGGQQWLVYDSKRRYGFFYDMKEVREVYFTSEDARLLSGWLSDDLLAADELLFQQMWRTYFKATTIRERINPKQQRRMMPVRFWGNLPEKRK